MEYHVEDNKAGCEGRCVAVWGACSETRGCSVWRAGADGRPWAAVARGIRVAPHVAPLSPPGLSIQYSGVDGVGWLTVAGLGRAYGHAALLLHLHLRQR